MAYSELIKDFSKIRNYMRQFYVYGFKTRGEYEAKSARSYDNEKRRIESWLGEYMSFRQESAGKISYISVDSGKVEHNPLYNAFKAKSFTTNDIVLNFFILDILQDGESLSASEITDLIAEDYLSYFPEAKIIDEATVRNKLKEYEKEGILKAAKDGRRLTYSLEQDKIDLSSWQEAIDFFSETDPVGVIGSFLLDKLPDRSQVFSYKHHYILHALESDILCTALDCMSRDLKATITLNSPRKKNMQVYEIIPLRIAMSTETGRGYLLAAEMSHRRLNMYRLDRIEEITPGEVAAEKAKYMSEVEVYIKYLWNTSSGRNQSTYHLEMILHIEDSDEHILRRLEREGKHGSITALEDNRYRYSIDVYDAGEMIPWIRTFTGRIEKLSCTNPSVTETFYHDLDALYDMYGGEK